MPKPFPLWDGAAIPRTRANSRGLCSERAANASAWYGRHRPIPGVDPWDVSLCAAAVPDMGQRGIARLVRHPAGWIPSAPRSFGRGTARPRTYPRGARVLSASRSSRAFGDATSLSVLKPLRRGTARRGVARSQMLIHGPCPCVPRPSRAWDGAASCGSYRVRACPGRPARWTVRRRAYSRGVWVPSAPRPCRAWNGSAWFGSGRRRAGWVPSVPRRPQRGTMRHRADPCASRAGFRAHCGRPLCGTARRHADYSAPSWEARCRADPGAPQAVCRAHVLVLAMMFLSAPFEIFKVKICITLTLTFKRSNVSSPLESQRTTSKLSTIVIFILSSFTKC